MSDMSKTSLPADFVATNWTWDGQFTGEEVQLSSDQEAAYFFVDPVIQSTGTVAVRGSRGFAKGKHYWEIVFLEPPCGTSVMVGVGTAQACLKSQKYINLIGKDTESWGLSYKGQVWHAGESRKFCEPFFAQETVIGILLDMEQGTLTFYKDGVLLGPGPAFTGLGSSAHEARRRLYPMISSTACETELGLGARLSQLGQADFLQTICLHQVRWSVRNKKDVDKLPLPGLFKRHLKELEGC